MKKWTFVQLLIIVSVSFVFAVPEVDKPAPDFTIYNLDTKDSVTLSHYRGHKVVLLISGNLC